MKYRIVILSASVQLVITAGTALAAAAADSTLTGIEIGVALIGACVAAAKDIQAHMLEPPR